jgi:hypothetical protein
LAWSGRCRRHLAEPSAGQARSSALRAATWSPRYATSFAPGDHRREHCRRYRGCCGCIDRSRVEFAGRRCARRASYRLGHSSPPHIATYFCHRAKLSADSMMAKIANPVPSAPLSTPSWLIKTKTIGLPDGGQVRPHARVGLRKSRRLSVVEHRA